MLIMSQAGTCSRLRDYKEEIRHTDLGRGRAGSVRCRIFGAGRISTVCHRRPLDRSGLGWGMAGAVLINGFVDFCQVGNMVVHGRSISPSIFGASSPAGKTGGGWLGWICFRYNPLLSIQWPSTNHLARINPVFVTGISTPKMGVICGQMVDQRLPNDKWKD